MRRYCPKCFGKFDGELKRCPNDGEKLVLVADQDLVGKVLDERYRILSKLGEGGMGTVYVAEQAMIGRKVALKVLRGAMVQDESSVKRFLIEAKAIASLTNAHTITLHDFGVTAEGLLYFTMELLEGAPLSEVIKSDAPMDYARAAKLLLQTCRSLEEAHDKGILHRDLKPDNLFVTWSKEGEHVTVLDFGIAKLADSSVESITKTGMICGTPAYLSPEQAQGYPAVPASDLYALGIIFYEMLAGEPPFSDTTAMRILMKHINESPKPISVKNPDVQVPVSMETFFLRALSKNPAERFPTVEVFRSAIEDALRDAKAGGETSALPSLGTSAQGLRSITADLSEGLSPSTVPMDEDPMAGTMVTPGTGIDPMAGTMGTELDPIVESGSSPTDTEAGPVPQFAAPPRWRLWAAVAAVAAIAAGLLVWSPWAGDPKPELSAVAGTAKQPPVVDVDARPAPEPRPAPPPAEPATTEQDVVIATPDIQPEKIDEIIEAPVVPDVVEEPAPTADSIVIEEDVVSLDMIVEPEDAAPVEAEAPEALAPYVDIEAEKKAEQKLAEERRRKRAERHAAEKAATEKAAAEKAAAEKAAAEKAAAEKAAAEKVASPGLGFRKVNVEDDKKDKDPLKKDGLGFRKIKVEEKK